MRALLLAAVVALAACFGGASASGDPRIKHIVVVMMENRAFDHMLGFLKRVNPNINGLTGTESNPANASDPNSRVYTVNDQAAYVDPDPGHGIEDTTQQLWGGNDQTQNPPPMNGFIENAAKHFSNVDAVMSCFDQATVPVISTLALEFALFDSWHASVPGPTMPNRAYLQSCTSHGAGTNNVIDIALGYPQKSIFQSLNDSGKTWGVYFEEIPTALQLKDVRKQEYLDHNFHGISKFAEDCNAGTLPDFSFVEPIYFETGGVFATATDQHPSHDVSAGEKFMAAIYGSLRNSTSWNDTLLIITYDEHGGFYDHVPTPLDGIPSPDGLNYTHGHETFTFERLGIRVPTIMISPYIEAGTVVHDPPNPKTPTSKYDHTSVHATLLSLGWITTGYLTKRDEWAGTFEHILTRTEPRTDCPMTLPEPPAETAAHAAWAPKDGQQPISEFQRELLVLASGLNGEQLPAADFEITESEASFHIRAKMKKLLGREIPPYRPLTAPFLPMGGTGEVSWFGVPVKPEFNAATSAGAGNSNGIIQWPNGAACSLRTLASGSKILLDDGRVMSLSPDPVFDRVYNQFIADSPNTDRHVVSVVSGGAHTLLLTAAGTVHAWGANENAQLGIGHTRAPDQPNAKPKLKFKPATAAKAVGSHDNKSDQKTAAAATSDGVIESIDLDRYIRKYSSSKPVRALHNGQGLAAGKTDSPPPAGASPKPKVKVARPVAEEMKESAASAVAAMSDAEREAAVSTIVEITTFQKIPDSIVSIVAGKSHSLALTSTVVARASRCASIAAQLLGVLTDEGGVYAWGRNAEGQCGIASVTPISVITTPKYVSALKGHTIVAIAACANMSAAITNTGLLFLWGVLWRQTAHSPVEYRLPVSESASAAPATASAGAPASARGGDGTINPIRAVALGTSHVAMLNDSGELYTMGLGHCGQLGLGRPPAVVAAPDAKDGKAVVAASTYLTEVRSPMRVESKQWSTGDQRLVGVVCSDFATAVLTESGHVYRFGSVQNGKLGPTPGAAAGDVFEPTRLESLANRTVSFIALNNERLLCLVPSHVESVRPLCASKTGGTRLTLTGVGWYDTGAPYFVNFVAAGREYQAKGRYDSKSQSVEVIVPAIDLPFSSTTGTGNRVSVRVSLNGTFYSNPLSIHVFSPPSKPDASNRKVSPNHVPATGIPAGCHLSCSVQLDAVPYDNILVRFRSRRGGGASTNAGAASVEFNHTVPGHYDPSDRTLSFQSPVLSLPAPLPAANNTRPKAGKAPPPPVVVPTSATSLSASASATSLGGASTSGEFKAPATTTAAVTAAAAPASMFAFGEYTNLSVPANAAPLNSSPLLPALIDFALDGQNFIPDWNYDLQFYDVRVAAVEPRSVGFDSYKINLFTSGIHYPEQLHVRFETIQSSTTFGTATAVTVPAFFQLFPNGSGNANGSDCGVVWCMSPPFADAGFRAGPVRLSLSMNGGLDFVDTRQTIIVKAPVVTRIAPTNGLLSGGTVITVSGIAFYPSVKASVKFTAPPLPAPAVQPLPTPTPGTGAAFNPFPAPGDVAAAAPSAVVPPPAPESVVVAARFVSDTTLTVVSPPMTRAGTVTLSFCFDSAFTGASSAASSRDGPTFTGAFPFVMHEPVVITSMLPAHALVAGGTEVTIEGRGFLPVDTIRARFRVTLPDEEELKREEAALAAAKGSKSRSTAAAAAKRASTNTSAAAMAAALAATASGATGAAAASKTAGAKPAADAKDKSGATLSSGDDAKSKEKRRSIETKPGAGLASALLRTNQKAAEAKAGDTKGAADTKKDATADAAASLVVTVDGSAAVAAAPVAKAPREFVQIVPVTYHANEPLPEAEVPQPAAKGGKHTGAARKDGASTAGSKVTKPISIGAAAAAAGVSTPDHSARKASLTSPLPVVGSDAKMVPPKSPAAGGSAAAGVRRPASKEHSRKGGKLGVNVSPPDAPTLTFITPNFEAAGPHEVELELSMNDQQFVRTGLMFHFEIDKKAARTQAKAAAGAKPATGAAAATGSAPSAAATAKKPAAVTAATPTAAAPVAAATPAVAAP